MIEQFRFLQGDFAACGRRVSFPAMGKKPMAQATLSCPFGAIHLEDRRGRLRMGTNVPIFALPPVPRYGGRPPEKFSKVFGAQNLSDGSEFPPGHWALGVQKLPLVRFNFCAWL